MKVNRRQLFTLSLLACGTGAIGVPAMGQKPAIEIFAGSQRVTGGAQRDASANVGYAEFPREVDAPRLPAETAALATELSATGTDAFDRGLMPLGDYLEQLKMIHLLELQLAAQRQDRAGMISSAQRRVSRLEEAALRLQSFNQPASEGWAADTMLAQAVLAEARAEVATLQGRPQAARSASADFEKFAQLHLEQRLEDSDLGICSLPTLDSAVLMVNRAPTGAQREFQENVLFTMREWNKEGAGIGRDDLLDIVQVRSSRNQMDLAIQGNNGTLFEAALSQADTAAREMFDYRLKAYDQGTASLGDLTQAWVVRTDLHRLAAGVEGAITKDMKAERQQALSDLRQVASSTTDLRGRNQSDVLFVKLLDVGESAEALTRPVPTVSGKDR